MINLFKKCIFVFFFIASSNSFAFESFYMRSAQGVEFFDSTAEGVCQQWLNRYPPVQNPVVFKASVKEGCFVVMAGYPDGFFVRNISKKTVPDVVCTPPMVPDPLTNTCVAAPNLCASKAGQSAGSINVAIPSGTCKGGAASAAISDKQAARDWLKGPMSSCHEGCLTSVSSAPDTKDATKCDASSGILYMSVPSKFTGESCSAGSGSGSAPSVPDSSVAPPAKSPQSQNDCPPKTTFGTVNNVPSCVKNAPAPNATPSPEDGKICVGNCDKWGIPSTDKPTDGGAGNPDSKPSGGGVTGDGQQDKPMTGGGTAGEKVEAKDEEGNDVSGDNAGFADINQDDIYKSKYKDVSFGKIWTDKKEALLQTGFIAGITESFPKFQSGGSIPTYSIDFSALGLGRAPLEIDPRVWLFIKACIILTACFTARKIIW